MCAIRGVGGGAFDDVFEDGPLGLIMFGSGIVCARDDGVIGYRRTFTATGR
eukprot:SAG11_NODE_38090_length_254_cov_0.529032_1_plen_50_part_01